MSVLFELKGRHFCCSHARPDDVARCHMIGQSVMLDNGAFSKWKKNKPTNWPAFYEWCDKWLAYASTWAVIPDVIDGGSQLQDALIKEWPFKERGAPVWHMDEPIDRLLRLCDEWPRVCVGSTQEFAVVMSSAWKIRIEDMFNALAVRHRHLPWLHMLRGMQLSGGIYPFASVDSTDIAQNHHRLQNSALKMATRWDSLNNPGEWKLSTEKEPERILL